MSEGQIIPIIVDNLDIEKEKKDESFEEYQIIKEDYCSSPKCGIKSKIVTKSVEKIIFSPVEISTKPYFKYCVTPGKDEHFKYDFSQSETNHTRNQEDKNQKKNINNISYYQKNSYLDFNKDGLKEEKNENGQSRRIVQRSQVGACFILSKNVVVHEHGLGEVFATMNRAITDNSNFVQA